MNSATSHTYRIDFDTGLLAAARQCPSPNQDERPGDAIPSLIVIHGISLPPDDYGGPFIERLFTNLLDWDEHPYFSEIRDLRVSAHILIRRDGEIIQFVPFHRRAWHAGESAYRGAECCNDFSVGIELEGSDDQAYDDQQYQALDGCIAALARRYPGLGARQLVAHCDISPGRKTDPGPAFDWLRLYDGIKYSNTEKS